MPLMEQILLCAVALLDAAIIRGFGASDGDRTHGLESHNLAL